jgi:mannitol/fructose-specific phosphotransferase system IIA component (Ntr-type)
MERQRDMITIGNILRPKRMDLTLGAAIQEEAIYRVASLLKDDDRVKDWNAFYSTLIGKNPCVANGNNFEICIPHARTDAVSAMVMAFGRSSLSANCENNGIKVRYIFVIGVPTALAADYLRIIGALARIFKDPLAESSLRQASTVEQLLTILASNEMKL